MGRHQNERGCVQLVPIEDTSRGGWVIYTLLATLLDCAIVSPVHIDQLGTHTLYFSVCVTLMPNWGHLTGSF